MAEQQEERQQSRSAGKVLWFNDQKGFGFIRPDDESEDLFVHQSSIKSDGYRSLAEGESVEFTVSQGNGGKTQAVDVTAIGGSPISKRDRRGGGGGGFGGGWRGGNERRNGNGCYNCGDLNHLARDCSKNASNYNDSDNYNNVPNGGGGSSYCYNCGEAGHFARDCKRDSGGFGGGGAGKCYNCGKYGHFARECNRNIGGSGSGGGSCFVCGGFGHLARDCDNNREVKCFNCGEAGHYARECANSSGKKDYIQHKQLTSFKRLRECSSQLIGTLAPFGPEVIRENRRGLLIYA
ncbi:cold shock protein 1-like isoform X2 [Herrania umbratica]|uniref:Cold shock protein 1-like isoform X2 n=1 Tax=Herrania umbratica TaxID=108875 RepID=A0A6J0ZK65_9ROSI|nr:cold shock protein 1-like isoform X2 [Herrania umbratica]XP_021275216.1 cold shock protein 1-like isoform X2 [Herrania umbratica]